MHNILHYTYPENVDKKKVKKELDHFVSMEDWQEGCVGLANDIRWIDGRVYDNYGVAQKAIEALDKGWYDQLAVKYYAPIPFANDKRKELEKAVEECWKEYNERSMKLYPKTLTSAYIGCKECGSKLSAKHLASNQCPVCKKDLRPDYIMKSIESAKNKWQKANEKLNEYVDKRSKKKVCWLVKIEYHT